MNGQQHVLHHIIDVVGRDAATPRDRLDDRDAVAQQRLVGGAISSLRRRHPGRPAQVRADILRVNGVHAAFGSPLHEWAATITSLKAGSAGKRACIGAPGGRCHHVLLTCRAHARAGRRSGAERGKCAPSLLRWMMAKGYIVPNAVRIGGKTDIGFCTAHVRFDPKRTLTCLPRQSILPLRADYCTGKQETFKPEYEPHQLAIRDRRCRSAGCQETRRNDRSHARPVVIDIATRRAMDHVAEARILFSTEGAQYAFGETDRDGRKHLVVRDAAPVRHQLHAGRRPVYFVRH